LNTDEASESELFEWSSELFNFESGPSRIDRVALRSFKVLSRESIALSSATIAVVLQTTEA